MSKATAIASATSSGISLPGLLTVAFVVLKLTGYVTWSWWWVLSPLWITAALIALVLLVVLVFLLFVGRS